MEANVLAANLEQEIAPARELPELAAEGRPRLELARPPVLAVQ